MNKGLGAGLSICSGLCGLSELIRFVGLGLAMGHAWRVFVWCWGVLLLLLSVVTAFVGHFSLIVPSVPNAPCWPEPAFL